LTAADEAKVEALMVAAKTARQPEADVIKGVQNKAELVRLVSTGVSKSAAREQVERSSNGILTGSHPLQFSGLPVITVADVLRDSARYHEWECLDPDESLNPDAHYRAMCFKNEHTILVHTKRHEGGNFTLDKIEIRHDQDNPINVMDQIETALSTGCLPDIFNWGGVLSYIGRDGAVRSLTAATAPVIIGRLVRLYSMKLIKDEWVRVRIDLSDKFWRAFLEKGSWNVPKLEGIVHAPYFYDDGVVQTQGYNPKSGLYLTKDFEFRGIKNATPEMGEEALTHLRGLLSTFPFESPTDEAVAVVMMLTAIQRARLETAPGFFVSANTPASGKTQLLTGIASLMTGTAPAVHGFRDNEQEFAKMLFAALIQGASSILIDNVKPGVALGGDAFCAILTAPVYVDRELGHSRNRVVPTRSLVGATGQNIKPAADATRRVMMLRLDPQCERPELRKFEINFVQLCREQREPIIKSVLTILSAYHAAKCPKVDNIRLGTFEQWSDEVCAPLVWLGMVDPALGQARADADEGIAGLGELLAVWRHEINYQRLTTAEVLHHAGVAEWFRNEFDDKGGVSVRKVGRLLAKYAGRIIDGCRIVSDGTLHRAVVWKFEDVS